MRILLASLAALLSTSAYAEGKLSLSTGVEYSTGDYYATTSTDIWMVPLSMKYKSGPLTLRASTSWLHITGPGGVTPEGEPVAAAGKKTTEQGMGDVSVSASWALLESRSAPLNLDVGARMKIATADEKKSLGTGENDYALFVDLSKPVGDWYPFAKLGYSWRGDPAWADYRNVWYGNVGVDYRISKTLSTGFYYDWREQLTATGSEVSEATVYLNVRIDDSNRLNIYTGGGFSEASPDWNLGLSLTHNF